MMVEKGIDLEQAFEIETAHQFHLMPYGVVIEAAKTASPSEQTQIKNILVKIDFQNGDVCQFLRHPGKGLALMQEPGYNG